MNHLAHLALLGTEVRVESLLPLRQLERLVQGDAVTGRLLAGGVAASAAAMDELLAGMSTRQEERA